MRTRLESVHVVNGLLVELDVVRNRFFRTKSTRGYHSVRVRFRTFEATLEIILFPPNKAVRFPFKITAKNVSVRSLRQTPYPFAPALVIVDGKDVYV